MRKIKRYNKDKNYQGNIDYIGSLNFTVTENGWGDLSIETRDEVEQADIIQIVEDGDTEQIITGNEHLSFNGTSQYAITGDRRRRRPRYFPNLQMLDRGNDSDGPYLHGFTSGTNPKYADIGRLYEQIDIGKELTVKLVFRTGTTDGHLLSHGTFQAGLYDNEFRFGFMGGNFLSFPTTNNTYYRVVAKYDGTNWTGEYNGNPIVGSATIGYTTVDHAVLGVRLSDISMSTHRTGRVYGFTFRDRQLSSGEITAENGSHDTVTAGGFCDFTMQENGSSPGPLLSEGHAMLNGIQFDDIRDGKIPVSKSCLLSSDFSTVGLGNNTLFSQPIITAEYARMYINSGIARIRADRTGTLNNGTVSGTVINSGNDIRFDESNPMLVFDALNYVGKDNEFSYSFWLNFDTNSRTNTQGRLIKVIRFSANRFIVNVYEQLGQYILVAGIFDGTSYTSNKARVGITAEERHYVHITNDGTPTGLKLYVNNIERTDTGTPSAPGGNIYEIGETQFRGSINQIAIHDRVLTEAERTQAYNTNRRLQHPIRQGIRHEIRGTDYSGSPSIYRDMHRTIMSEAIITEGRKNVTGAIYEEGGVFNSILCVDGATITKHTHDGEPQVQYSEEIRVGTYGDGIDTGYFRGGIGRARVYEITGYDESKNDLVRQGVIDGTGIIDWDFADVDFNGLSSGNFIMGNIDGINKGNIWNIFEKDQSTTNYTNTENRTKDSLLYYGRVIRIIPYLDGMQQKRYKVDCIGIQTIYNDIFYRNFAQNQEFVRLANVTNFIARVFDLSDVFSLEGNDLKLQRATEFQKNDDVMLTYFVDSHYTRHNLREHFGTNALKTAPDGTEVRRLRQMRSGSQPIMIFTQTGFGNADVIFTCWLMVAQPGTTVTVRRSVDGVTFLQRAVIAGLSHTERRKVSVLIPGASNLSVRITFDNGINGIRIAGRQHIRVSTSNLAGLDSFPYELNISNNKIYDIIQQINTLSGTRIVWNENIRYINALTSQPIKHYIEEARHCSFLENGEYSDGIVNAVEVEYTGGTTAQQRDNASIAQYGLREGVVKATIFNNNASAVEFAQNYLTETAQPKKYVKIIVNRNYPIHSLNIGDTVRIQGNTLAIDTGLITRLDYRDNDVVVYIGHYDGLNRALSLFR